MNYGVFGTMNDLDLSKIKPATIDGVTGIFAPFKDQEKFSFVASYADANEKEDVVHIVRYLRPPGHLDYSNLFGITLVITLDYKHGEIVYRYSICSGDNFDRRLGKKLAYQSRSYMLNMPKNRVFDSNGVVSYILENDKILNNKFDKLTRKFGNWSL